MLMSQIFKPRSLGKYFMEVRRSLIKIDTMGSVSMIDVATESEMGVWVHFS